MSQSPVRHSTPRASVLVLLAAGVAASLVPGSVSAREKTEAELIEAAAAEAASNALAPSVRWIGFQDRPGDCDLAVAAYGHCVELVDFLDPDQAWKDGERANKAQLALKRDMADLSAQLWEALAYRWGDKEDVIKDTLVAAGLINLPTPGSVWDVSDHAPRWNFSMPEASRWLYPLRWLQDKPLSLEQMAAEEPDGRIPGAPFFRDLRYHHPSGVPTPPPMVLLKGRFATRLAYDGRRHAFDLMDGDLQSSGPFFEQMYPYDTAREMQDIKLAPLAHFIASANLKRENVDARSPAAEAERREAFAAVSFRSSEGYDAARAIARQEFMNFYHLVGTQILRFALEEYTPTHLRVLTSLIAMDTPPGRQRENAAARNVVAASEGQTDDEAMLSGMVAFQSLVRGRGFAINFSQLPPKVIAEYVERFDEWHHPTDDFLWQLNKEVFDSLQDLLRQGSNAQEFPIRDLSDAGLERWVDERANPGSEPEVSRHLKRIGLEVMVARLPDDLRDEVQTRLLLDHVELDVSSRFDPTPGYRATPADQEAQTATQWKNVLSKHSFYPAAIPDGPGAVDPVAICTTRDRKEALGEPSFGAVDLDVLVTGKDGIGSAEDLLWSARDRLPFLLVDDPLGSMPKIERLVGLPEGQALYRVRWQLWTGWHLLWGVESLGQLNDNDANARHRVVMRTAAVCEDTVIASPDLVPTLLRAALLDGDFRHSTPVTGLSRRERKDIEDRERLGLGQSTARGPSNDEVVSDAVTTENTGQEIGASGERAVTVSEDDPTRVDDIAIANASRLGGLVNRKDTGQRIQLEPASGPVAYVQNLMRRPLEGLAASEKAMLVLVYDAARGKRARRLWSWRPRSPYAREQERAGSRDWVRVALWATDVQVADGVASTTLMVPAWKPTESVSAGSVTPRWKRHTHTEFTLAGSVGMFPWREVTYSCPDDETTRDDVNDPSTLALCTEGESFSTAQTDGVGFDISSLYTWWLLDQPRVAVEIGPEVQVLLLPGGTGRFSSEGEPDYAFAWSARAGVLAGLRFAPDPSPLWLRGRRTPWGANGPDGSSRLGRVQYGIRAGALLGSGFNGFEGNATTELWSAWSLRRPQSKVATFTPYRPAGLVGPYLRGQLGLVLIPGDEDRYYEMDRRYEVLFGVRGQMRLGGGPVALPEVE